MTSIIKLKTGRKIRYYFKENNYYFSTLTNWHGEFLPLGNWEKIKLESSPKYIQKKYNDFIL